MVFTTCAISMFLFLDLVSWTTIYSVSRRSTDRPSFSSLTAFGPCHARLRTTYVSVRHATFANRRSRAWYREWPTSTVFTHTAHVRPTELALLRLEYSPFDVILYGRAHPIPSTRSTNDRLTVPFRVDHFVGPCRAPVHIFITINAIRRNRGTTTKRCVFIDLSYNLLVLTFRRKSQTLCLPICVSVDFVRPFRFRSPSLQVHTTQTIIDLNPNENMT